MGNPIKIIVNHQGYRSFLIEFHQKKENGLLTIWRWCRVAGNMYETRGGKQTCLFHDRRSQTEQHKRALMAKDRADTCAIAMRSSNKYDATHVQCPAIFIKTNHYICKKTD